MRLLTDHLQLGPVIFQGVTYSPEFVTRQIDEVARHLDTHCAASSPIVYLVATNHLKTVAGYFGTIKSGRVCLLVDPASRAIEWAEMLREAPPSAVILFEPSSDVLDLDREVTLYSNVLDEDAKRELENVCTLLFTAADDGYAKAAMLTHDNLYANARSVVECNHVDEATPSCSLIPFHHLFALQTGLIAPAICRSPAVLLGPDYLMPVTDAADDLRTAGVQRLYSVPPILYLLAKVWFECDVRPPANIVSGGVKLPASITERFRCALGIEVHEGYGLTEAAPVCAWHRPLDRTRPQSVGRAFDCCDIAISDEDGNTLPVDAVGEVCIRGANVMKGYFRNPDATARVLRNGWLRTADLGRVDQDGFLFLTGLKKRMLNVAGQKVYPKEVERMMRLHDNVEDATISGERQLLQGETVTGRVRLRKKSTHAEQQFRNWCLHNISAHKIPARIEFD